MRILNTWHSSDNTVGEPVLLTALSLNRLQKKVLISLQIRMQSKCFGQLIEAAAANDEENI